MFFSPSLSFLTLELTSLLPQALHPQAVQDGRHSAANDPWQHGRHRERGSGGWGVHTGVFVWPQYSGGSEKCSKMGVGGWKTLKDVYLEVVLIGRRLINSFDLLLMLSLISVPLFSNVICVNLRIIPNTALSLTFSTFLIVFC